MMADMDDGFLAINLSDAEDGSSSREPLEKPRREEKLNQSEEAFQTVKSSYEAKLQNGEVGPLLPCCVSSALLI
jgi:hypothetical protein